VYRGGAWLPPSNRMVPLPRRFVADTHGCIMVAGLNGPTEYKVVARDDPRPWHSSARTSLPFWWVDWECSASRLALARDRSAVGGLDPSAFPVRLARHSVGTMRRRYGSKKDSSPEKSGLTIKAPYKDLPLSAQKRQDAVRHLKRILKLDRLRLRGPNGARDEFHLAATAQNLRKLAKLIPVPAPMTAT
jgi:hypothetical protein